MKIVNTVVGMAIAYGFFYLVGAITGQTPTPANGLGGLSKYIIESSSIAWSNPREYFVSDTGLIFHCRTKPIVTEKNGEWLITFENGKN